MHAGRSDFAAAAARCRWVPQACRWDFARFVAQFDMQRTSGEFLFFNLKLLRCSFRCYRSSSCSRVEVVAWIKLVPLAASARSPNPVPFHRFPSISSRTSQSELCLQLPSPLLSSAHHRSSRTNPTSSPGPVVKNATLPRHIHGQFDVLG